MLSIGDVVPDSPLVTTDASATALVSLHAFQTIVLYFYPKNQTPGCTMEAKAFRNEYDLFAKNQVLVLGVSADSIDSHHRFKDKHQLPFHLVADIDKTLCEQFGVLKMRSFFGKTIPIIQRSTFIIHQGVITHAFRAVKLKGHVEAVLEALGTHLKR